MDVGPRLALEAVGVSKRFGGVVALDGAGVQVFHGEVMGMMGDNGAGKSTLVKTIAGIVPADSGTFRIEGRDVAVGSPAEAMALGIETVHQNLALVDAMNAVQNIFLGRELTRWVAVYRRLDVAAMRRTAHQLFDDLGARIPSLATPVATFSGGQRQAVAIARAVLWGRQIAILDEPTAALGVQETEHVLQIIERLKQRGVAVLVITHNLQHLFRVADRVTVLRLGRTVGVRRLAQTTNDEIVGLITGSIVDEPPASQ